MLPGSRTSPGKVAGSEILRVFVCGFGCKVLVSTESRRVQVQSLPFSLSSCTYSCLGLSNAFLVPVCSLLEVHMTISPRFPISIEESTALFAFSFSYSFHNRVWGYCLHTRFLGLSLLHFHHLSEYRRSLLTAGAGLTFFVSRSSFCKNGLLGNPLTHNSSSQKVFETETFLILPRVSSETAMHECPSWAGV